MILFETPPPFGPVVWSIEGKTVGALRVALNFAIHSIQQDPSSDTMLCDCVIIRVNNTAHAYISMSYNRHTYGPYYNHVCAYIVMSSHTTIATGYKQKHITAHACLQTVCACCCVHRNFVYA